MPSNALLGKALRIGAFYLVLFAVSTLMFLKQPFELWKYVYWMPGFNFIRVPSRFIIMTMLALGVLVFLLVFFIPRFQLVFAGFGAKLPLLTQMIIGASDVLRN